jgi:hypothetical protein
VGATNRETPAAQAGSSGGHGADSTVAKTEASEKSDVERASAKLSESLKTCRTVLESYRDVLAGGESTCEQPAEPKLEPNDNESSAAA